ncbi:MAG: ABC transporter ATP-binding protein [Pseudomonadota bacterium]
MSALIALNGAQKYFGAYHALRDIDLEIGQGEFFSLLGPSGCGKTTLLRAIAGFEALDAGSIHIDGHDMAGVPANRRPTNMVFQSYAIFPHLSVAENVAFGLRKRGLDAKTQAERVGGALEMVGLGGYGARAAHALSGGQRQRVALARALVLEPKVLLLDEPLSALDRKMREQMQGELRRLQRHVGITFILVTHDQEEALIMSDRIAVMFEGGIAQIDSPEGLYRRPASREVGAFIGQMNFLAGQVRSGTDGFVAQIHGLGHVPLAAEQSAEPLAAGAAAFGMRPESLSLLFDGQAQAASEATGRIADRAYYGDMTYYEVALDGVAEPVTISMKNMVGQPVLSVGDAARVAWDPRALIVFPGPGTA